MTDDDLEAKFDMETIIILNGIDEARKIRTHQENRILSDSDLRGKYLDAAKACEMQGKNEAAAGFRRNAAQVDAGIRAHLDYQ